MPTRSRRRFDDDDDAWSVAHTADRPIPDDDDDEQPSWSTYPSATHGPTPAPTWLVTDARAVDTDFGVMKTGKEADVSLLQRASDESSCWLAVKQYRDPKHRMFHRDASYLEGRRVRRSREGRAMATRTEFGRELIAGQWAAAEFTMLTLMWRAGVSVPYPVQLLGTELMMEFIGTDGVAAPRLAEVRPSVAEATDLFEQARTAMLRLADAGYAHGDLSPYNVLVSDGRLVLIDVPQAVDLVGNPQGFQFLRRDCANICTWFQARGVDADPSALERDLIACLPQ